MNSVITSRQRYKDIAVDVGVPLLAIGLLSTQYQVPLGAGSTVLAAVLAGVAIPLFDRYAVQLLLRACSISPNSATRYALSTACNAAIGVLAVLATLPKLIV